MARIVFGTLGSLGDLHPVLAVGVALRRRGHDVVVASSSCHREKILAQGLEFRPLRPDVPFIDPAFVRSVMDGLGGAARLLRDFILPAVREMHADLAAASRHADLLVTSELVYAAPLLAEQTNIPWASYSLAPFSLFSIHEPRVPPINLGGELIPWLPPFGLRALTWLAARATRSWWRPVRTLRRELNLSPARDPLFIDKHSPRLELALFSPQFARRQPDWPPQTRQTGFCFFDEPPAAGASASRITEFLAAGEPPIVFTLGSAAVYLANDFYAESARAARQLGRRALLLLGQNPPPPNLPPAILACDYAPYAHVFPRAAAIVHQGGVGTTAQALRAGRPMIVMPFGYDQFDNAAHVRRLGVSRTIPRSRYRAARIAAELRRLLENPAVVQTAAALGARIRAERGAEAAADELERVFLNRFSDNAMQAP